MTEKVKGIPDNSSIVIPRLVCRYSLFELNKNGVNSST